MSAGEPRFLGPPPKTRPAGRQAHLTPRASLGTLRQARLRYT